ncbi:hypothetical protein DPQ25_01925 [Hydrogeniiclostridium mannosilyticum]|uniref:Uncharacterized protein n=1 Tax=Hydrogeniiclostridium mannosilyticum TaxID=2764322 RepID=A0A328UEI3_9FIRM|nr:hypothetical protein DPQ25_01925 [Hydrogeniiclostridium mannosilyticum]
MRTPLSGYYSPEVCCYYSTAVFINKAADGILFAVYCIRTGAKAGICVIMATNRRPLAQEIFLLPGPF